MGHGTLTVVATEANLDHFLRRLRTVRAAIELTQISPQTFVIKIRIKK
jgi:hypothetical protein